MKMREMQVMGKTITEDQQNANNDGEKGLPILHPLKELWKRYIVYKNVVLSFIFILIIIPSSGVLLIKSSSIYVYLPYISLFFIWISFLFFLNFIPSKIRYKKNEDLPGLYMNGVEIPTGIFIRYNEIQEVQIVNRRFWFDSVYIIPKPTSEHAQLPKLFFNFPLMMLGRDGALFLTYIVSTREIKSPPLSLKIYPPHR